MMGSCLSRPLSLLDAAGLQSVNAEGGYSRARFPLRARYGGMLGALIEEWVNSDRMLTQIGRNLAEI